MVEVFKTNVQHQLNAEEISEVLFMALPDSTISFDLEDCDKILRIDSRQIDTQVVINALKKGGFYCEVLE
jgi:hypothetical protein